MSNWNCANCGKPASQFGHYDPRIPGFSCQPLSPEEKMQLVRAWRDVPGEEYSEELWIEYLCREKGR